MSTSTNAPDMDDLRRASTEQPLDRHIDEPLRHLTAELVQEVAERIRTALADLDQTLTGGQPCRDHWDTCWRIHAGCLAARIRRTLTGEDPADGDH